MKRKKKNTSGIMYPTLEFYVERRNRAYEFIKGSNEHPEHYPPNPYIEAADGGLYGKIGCEQRTLHNAGYPYGSITVAGLWSLYCVNKPWTPTRPPCDPVARNEVLWLENYHTPMRNPVNPSNANVIGDWKWYYYYIMTFMKAILMNGVTAIPGWYAQYRNHLVGIVKDTGCVPANWPYGHSLLYWNNPADVREPDVLATIFAILGIETALGPLPYNLPGMSPNRLYIELMSPAEIVVIDSEGKKTGCENGISYAEITSSRFSGCGTEPQRIEIDWPGGIYRVKIKATGEGHITIKAGTEFIGYRMSEYSRGITVTAGSEYEYTVSVGNVYWPMTLACSFGRGVEETPEATETNTVTRTITETRTASPTVTETYTETNTQTETMTRTLTITRTNTPTKTYTRTITETQTATPTITETITQTYSSTPTITRTMTITRTPTATKTMTRTRTATRTMTPTATRTATPLPVKIVLEFKSGDTYRYSASPHPQFRIKNKGVGKIDVSKLEIRYWYKYDGVLKMEESYVDWAGINGNPITEKVNISIVRGSFSGQDRYESVKFKVGAGEIGNGTNDYLEINTRFNKIDWSRYDQSNDWSFVGNTSFTEWEKVTVYYEGVKVWGKEPGELGYTIVSKEEEVEGMNERNTYVYPNPANKEVVIRYSMKGATGVKIEIYNLQGKKIWSKEKLAGEVREGVNYDVWGLEDDMGREVSNGVYIVKVKGGDKEITKKIAVVR